MQALRQALEHITAMEERVKTLQMENERKADVVADLKKKQKLVRFDEETIAEHDKERGTRMKIDEPDTPFHREAPDWSSLDDQDQAESIPHLGDLQVHKPVAFASEEEEEQGEDSDAYTKPVVPESLEKLKQATTKPTLAAGRPMALDLKKVNELVKLNPEERKRKGFEEARSRHYNEMEQLKKWREIGGLGSDEEEEEEES